MAGGFIQLNRDERVVELMRMAPNAFLLLTQIALRVRRTTGGINPHHLEIGEAVVGDFRSIGLSEQTYRTAKLQLSDWKMATFRATTRGTIASLYDSSIYDVNLKTGNGQANGKPTDGQRTANGQLTTNEECNNEKNGKKPPSGVQGGESRLPTSPMSQRISALFRKRHTTEWSEKDIVKYKDLGSKLLTDENMTVIEAYYAVERAKGTSGPERGIHRRNLSTFLNNFTCELDRAREWRENGAQPKIRPAAANPHLQGARAV